MIDEIRPEDLTATPAELNDIEQRFQATIPQEKATIERQGLAIGAALKAEGATAVEGMGQKMCEIPPRLYMRWKQHDPHFWDDEINVHKFLYDNPQYCAPGWKPWKHFLSKKHMAKNLKSD